MALKECAARSMGCKRRHHNQESCPLYQAMLKKQKNGSTPLSVVELIETQEEEDYPFDTKNEEEPEPEAPKTYVVLPENVSIAKEQIEKVNRRLEKAGIEERFEATFTERIITERSAGGIDKKKQVYDMVLNRPPVAYDGWEFIARLEKEPGGMMFYGVPGKELDNWDRPDEHLCEHCNKRITTRVKSYVLQDTDTGETKQVGSTCLGLFLGVEPKGLWSLAWEPSELDQPRSGGGGSGDTYVYDSREILAMTYLVSKEGEEFLSKSRARAWDQPSTIEKVMVTYERATRPVKARDTEAIQAQAEAIELIQKAKELANEQIIDDILDMRNTVNPGEYRDNLDVVTNSEYVSNRSLGTLASMVGILATKKRKEAAEKTKVPAVRGFVAPIGTKKLALPKTKILKMKEVAGYTSYYTHDDPTDTIVTMQTPAGNIIKWRASNKTREALEAIGMKEESDVNISSSIVKDHRSWTKSNGDEQDETWLKNVRLEKPKN